MNRLARGNRCFAFGFKMQIRTILAGYVGYIRNQTKRHILRSDLVFVSQVPGFVLLHHLGFTELALHHAFGAGQQILDNHMEQILIGLILDID